MRGVGYGRWGMHQPGLYFETWLADGSATLQLLFGKAVTRLLAEARIGVEDVGQLEGRTCSVDIDGYHVRYTGLAPAAPASTPLPLAARETGAPLTGGR